MDFYSKMSPIKMIAKHILCAWHGMFNVALILYYGQRHHTKWMYIQLKRLVECILTFANQANSGDNFFKIWKNISLILF